ncbi:hypothetical protein M1349_02915 [Patescibacteria group bacterium]|nr:hypothetical protein [Patescibacteria group bacterium]
MKKTTIIALFVFWAITSAVLTAGLVFSEKKSDTKQKAVLGSSKKENLQQDIKLTTAEVAKHSSSDDCWMIISNKVYDFTDYMNSHPGGAGTIIPYCGKDGTSAFVGKPHSQYAQTLLPNYYIGDLNSTIPDKKISQSVTPTPGKLLKTSQLPASPPPATNYNPTAPVQIPQSGGVVLTAAEVAKHSSSGDCWMIINNKVYNVTSYVSAHPGGTGSISAYCGKDGTSAFAGHSQNANNILTSYYIGDLGNSSVQQTTTGQATTTVGQQVPQATTQGGTSSRTIEDDD